MSLSELSARLELKPSTTHGIVRTLVEHGMVVQERGSRVGRRSRLVDIAHARGVTGAERGSLDGQIDGWIRADDSVKTRIMSLQDALLTGAMALFGEKYGKNVRVVSMGGSTELCGGTHCAATGQIGEYITTQETSISAGIRRIEALTGRGADAYLRRRSALVEAASARLQAQPEQLESRVEQLAQELAAARKLIAQYQREAAQQQTETLAHAAKEVEGVPVVATTASVPDEKLLREMGDLVLHRLGRPGVVVLAGNFDERIGLQVSVSPELVKRGLHAGKIAGAVGERLGGRGGGRPESAQGGGKNKAELGAALDIAAKLVKESLQA